MYICTECGALSAKWQGKCFSCGSWGTLEPRESDETSAKTSGGKARATHALSETQMISEAHRSALESAELSRVLGGGVVAGGVILLSGEPGIGKSTLSLQMAAWYAQSENPALYVTAEETLWQLSERAKRLGIAAANVHAAALSDLDDIIETARESGARLIIIDSVSMITSREASWGAGSIVQIRAVAERLIHYAKQTGTSIVLVGHVTKDGAVSGPKILEHLVDTVLFFEGVRYENYRILRALKNRFWPTDEIGLFRMEAWGLRDMPNPGIEFVKHRDASLTGSVLTVAMEGTRPLLVEIEALTTYTKFGYPKRSSRGIPQGKLDLVIAIANRYAEAKLDSYDVYVNISRGLSVAEPGIDLALLAAILSARWKYSLGNAVFLGELSLTGTIRPVPSLPERLKLLKDLAFETIVLPKESESKKIWKHAQHVWNIEELVALFWSKKS